MASLTDSFVNGILDHYFINSSMANVGDATGLPASATAGSLYVSGHSADPGDSGSQTTSELSYTGYARAAVARSGSGWSRSGKTVSNVAAVSTGQRTDAGAAQTFAFAGIGRSSSGAGTLDWKVPVGQATAPLMFTALASSDVVSCPGHSLANDDKVVLSADVASALPAGLTEGTVYYVIGVSGITFQLSATFQGSAINITADGAGVIWKHVPLSVTQNVNPQFAAGQLTAKME